MVDEDEYADYSDEELEAELLALERDAEGELEMGQETGQELAPDPTLDVDISSGEEILDHWDRAVTDFGGRISSPAKRSLLTELGQGQLGQTKFLPTSQANPIFETLLLAEVYLSRAVPMDVTFNYTNMQPPGLAFGTGVPALDQGNGFVRITWGAPGTFKRTADIDGNRGWRRQFSASFMRVEYVPEELSMANLIQGGQDRDLGVAAMISPAVGSVSTTLTKTVFFADIAGGQVRTQLIPRWATNFQMAGDWDDFDDDWEVFLTDAQTFTVQHVGSNGAESPWLLSVVSKFPVPQRAQRIFLRSGPNTEIDNPTAIFELAL